MLCSLWWQRSNIFIIIFSFSFIRIVMAEEQYIHYFIFLIVLWIMAAIYMNFIIFASGVSKVVREVFFHLNFETISKISNSDARNEVAIMKCACLLFYLWSIDVDQTTLTFFAPTKFLFSERLECPIWAFNLSYGTPFIHLSSTHNLQQL